MALLPLLDLLSDQYRRSALSDIYDQHFGLGINNDVHLIPSTLLSAPLRCGYSRPWRNLAAGDSGISSFQSDKNEFRINLDVQQFKPEELKVKVENDFIIVEGKHDERSDEHGFISRQFTRKYHVPKDVDDSTLTSSLSSDGVLVLKAAKKSLPGSQGKDIPIIRTNEPAVKNKKPENRENSDNMEQ